MKIATVEIDNCEQCPFFDNEYYSYERMCTKLDQKYTYEMAYPGEIKFLPGCPLPDMEKEK